MLGYKNKFIKWSKPFIYFRAVQRIEAMRRSPIFSHLSSSLNGIALIRSSGAEKLLVEEFDTILNLHTSSWFTKIAIMRWFASVMDYITWGMLMVMP